MQESPLVSIVIPLYNAFPYIVDMLESIAKQTYSNWELLVVDDGSTDKGPEVVKEYMQKDSRIRYFLRPDHRKKGGNTCRNIGLEKAKGKYIIWFDADDIIAHYCLEQRVKFMEENSNLDFGVFPALGFIEKPGNWIDLFYFYKNEKKVLNHLISKNLPFVVWTNIYLRDSLINSNNGKGTIWDENLTSLQDADFNIETIRAGLQFKGFEGSADYFWQSHPGSITTTIASEKQLKNHIYFLNKLIGIFKDDRNFRIDLKRATLWSYKFLINNEGFWFKELIKNDYFKNFPIFKIKLKILRVFYKNFSNKNIRLLISILFFPILNLRDRYDSKFFPFRKIRNTKYQNLIQLTNKRI